MFACFQIEGKAAVSSDKVNIFCKTVAKISPLHSLKKIGDKPSGP